MSGLFVALVLILTVSLATLLGIATAYYAIDGILYAFAHQARPSKASAPALAPGGSHAGGD